MGMCRDVQSVRNAVLDGLGEQVVIGMRGTRVAAMLERHLPKPVKLVVRVFVSREMPILHHAVLNLRPIMLN